MKEVVSCVLKAVSDMCRDISDGVYTFFVDAFRFMVDISDTEVFFRRRSGRTPFEVLFLSNYRDERDVQAFGHKGVSVLPTYMEWIRMSFGQSHGQLRMIGSTANDLLHSAGIRKGQEQFLEAVRSPLSEGSRVVLFGATTKRLFGRDAARLRELYPSVVFSIGDNFTLMILQEEVLRMIRLTSLSRPRVLVIGPSGHLGGGILAFLIKRGFQVVGLGTDAKRARLVSERHSVRIFSSYEEVGHDGAVDLVVACNHAEPVRLRPDRMECIRRTGRKLVVIDVCEPYNLDQDMFRSYADRVIRVDANAYSPDLRYVLGSVASGLLRLDHRSLWGCFLEALLISEALRHGDREIADADWMVISSKNQDLLRRVMKQYDLQAGLPPEPFNFGKPVYGSFALTVAADV